MNIPRSVSFVFPFLPLFLASFLMKSKGDNGFNSSYCPIRDCGKLQVKYPFWFQNNSITSSQQYCGYKGFGLTCVPSSLTSAGDDQLVLQLARQRFFVKSINYDNLTLTLVDFDVTYNRTCPRPSQNLTLAELPLDYSVQDLNLTFYFNCTVSPTFNSTPLYPVLCLRSGGKMSYVSLDTNDFDWYKDCEEKVVASVIEGKIMNGGLAPNWVSSFGGVMNEGFALEWGTEINCASCEWSDGLCGFNNTSKEFLCFCKDGSIKINDDCKATGHRSKLRRKIAIEATVGGMGLVIGLIIFLFKFKKSSVASKDDSDLRAFIKQHGSMTPKRYPYSDIKKMTNSFKVEVGKGGYGTVYKGNLQDGHLVAVKILNPSKGNGEEFINEVFSTGKTSHVNVVTLLGFCLEGKRRALVYDYMPNGSLEKYIHSKSYYELGMDKLYQISLGVARGLEYLHRGCNTRILHFDIKPHNILLDEDFCPKISDFGLAKQCTNRDSIVSLSISGARGTIGYIAPELISRNFGPVSYKSDVYSYGMMILEIVGRRKNVNAETSHTSEIYFPHWAYQHLIVHKDLRLKGIVTPEEDEIVKKIILVGLWCIQNDPSLRPRMSKVIELLEGSLQAIEIPPKAFFCSPSISPQDST